jgi:hypothetical protein
MKSILIYTILGFLISTVSFAQQPAVNTKAATSGGAKKTTDINFEDELIEGEVKKPELMYLLQKKQFNFKRLIKLRENFLPEMNRASESIQRSRGVN